MAEEPDFDEEEQALADQARFDRAKREQFPLRPNEPAPRGRDVPLLGKMMTYLKIKPAPKDEK